MTEIFSVSIEESVARTPRKVPEVRRHAPSGKSLEGRSGPTGGNSGCSVYLPHDHAPFDSAPHDAHTPSSAEPDPPSEAEEPFMPADEADEVREALQDKNPSEWEEGRFSVSSEKSVDELRSEAIDDPASDFDYLEHQAKKRRRNRSPSPHGYAGTPRVDSFIDEGSEFYAFQKTKRKRQSEPAESLHHRDLLESMVEADRARVDPKPPAQEFPEVKEEPRSTSEADSSSHLSEEVAEEDPVVSQHRFGVICEAQDSCNALIEQAAAFRIRHLGTFRGAPLKPHDRKRAIVKRLRKDLRLLERLLEETN